ncbi:MAG: hypothetical protein L0Z55_08350 [Planctomycetes bacterium]|nr:hypothetical protein [Planctomycetota bacterium]
MFPAATPAAIVPAGIDTRFRSGRGLPTLQLRRILLRAAGALFFAIPLALFGCSGGDGGDEESYGASSEMMAKAEDSREDAERARKEAEAAEAQKYAGDAYQAAVADFQTGQGHFDSQKYDRARKYFKNALRDFTTARNSAKTAKGSYEVALDNQKECDALRAEAEKLGLQTKNPELWKAAEDLYAQGKTFLMNSKKLSNAKDKFNQAKYSYQELVDVAKGVVKDESAAKASLATMEANKEEARTAAAEEHAKSTWEQAASAETEGRSFLTASDYRRAAYSLDRARELYRMARENAEIRKTLASQPVATTEEKPDVSERAQPLSPEEIARRKQQQKEQAAGAGTDVAAALEKYFHGSPSFAADTGILTLDYTSGANLRKDVVISKNVKLGDKPHLTFEGSDWSGEFDEYSFHANTEGSFTINGRYRDGVRIEFDMKVLLVGSNAKTRFEVLFNYEPGDGGGSGYGVDWGTRLTIYENRKTPKEIMTPTNKTYHNHPTKWFMKQKPTHVVISYGRSPDGEDGKILVQFDNAGQMEDTFKMNSNWRREGIIAFRWDDLKVVVKNLRIIGKVDEDWARELVAKMGSGEEAEAGGADKPFGF